MPSSIIRRQSVHAEHVRKILIGIVTASEARHLKEISSPQLAQVNQQSSQRFIAREFYFLTRFTLPEAERGRRQHAVRLSPDAYCRQWAGSTHVIDKVLPHPIKIIDAQRSRALVLYAHHLQ